MSRHSNECVGIGPGPGHRDCVCWCHGRPVGGPALTVDDPHGILRTPPAAIALPAGPEERQPVDLRDPASRAYWRSMLAGMLAERRKYCPDCGVTFSEVVELLDAALAGAAVADELDAWREAAREAAEAAGRG